MKRSTKYRRFDDANLPLLCLGTTLLIRQLCNTEGTLMPARRIVRHGIRVGQGPVLTTRTRRSVRYSHRKNRLAARPATAAVAATTIHEEPGSRLSQPSCMTWIA